MSLGHLLFTSYGVALCGSRLSRPVSIAMLRLEALTIMINRLSRSTAVTLDLH